ncbi:MAG: oxygenase MpaB family protein, partial [Myxococcota bacterium]|nr:oxygenase MpaB family protein [Myxococcota bacterium]
MNTSETSRGEFERWLEALNQRPGDPVEGFFGPQSLIWQVNRELVLYVAGPRALLLQMAHPLVAQGVADHSNFETDSWGRAIRTFSAMYVLIYGTREEAMEMAARIRLIHTRVVGTLPDRVGPYDAGTPYRANDPALLRWVYATLVDSALVTYRDYLASGDQGVIDRCYVEMREGARLFGVDPEWLPATWTGFRQWMVRTIAGDEIVVSPVAR